MTASLSLTCGKYFLSSRSNSESEITYLPYGDAYPPGFEDMRRRVPDISKITQQFNWKPENDLDKIISDVADSLIKKT